MSITEDLWLRSQAAQSNFLQLANYNTAFLGNAALQTWQLAITAPLTFWSTFSRVGDGVAETVKDSIEAHSAVVTDFAEAAAEMADAQVEAQVEAATEIVEQTTADVIEMSDAVAAMTANPVLLDAPRGGAADDLTVLSGIGPKLAKALNEFGIFHYDQLADLTEDGIAWLNANQKGFAMTAQRYDLVGQAKAKLAG